MTNNNDITDLVLAKRLAATRNYLLEATMNDYSMASINRGQDHFNQLKQEALD